MISITAALNQKYRQNVKKPQKLIEMSLLFINFMWKNWSTISLVYTSYYWFWWDENNSNWWKTENKIQNQKWMLCPIKMHRLEKMMLRRCKCICALNINDIHTLIFHSQYASTVQRIQSSRSLFHFLYFFGWYNTIFFFSLFWFDMALLNMHRFMCVWNPWMCPCVLVRVCVCVFFSFASSHFLCCGKCNWML